MSECLLETKGIYKSFGPTRALVDVNLVVNRGEVRGLIGENGSGKSTLSSIVAGALAADEGTMFFKGKPFTPTGMVDAQKQGVSMVVQEMGTITGISVASNIFLGNLNQFRKKGLLSLRQMNKKAKEILAEIGVPEIDPTWIIDRLNFEDRKIVEIARAMYSQPEILIIDETTTALATKGRTLLYKIIEKMKSQNKAVLFISHDLDELMNVCNTIIEGNKIMEDPTVVVDREFMVLQSYEDYENYVKYVAGDIPPYTGDELKALIVSMNDGMTADSAKTLYKEYSDAYGIDDVVARHAALFD